MSFPNLVLFHLFHVVAWYLIEYILGNLITHECTVSSSHLPTCLHQKKSLMGTTRFMIIIIFKHFIMLNKKHHFFNNSKISMQITELNKSAVCKVKIIVFHIQLKFQA